MQRIDAQMRCQSAKNLFGVRFNVIEEDQLNIVLGKDLLPVIQTGEEIATLARPLRTKMVDVPLVRNLAEQEFEFLPVVMRGRPGAGDRVSDAVEEPQPWICVVNLGDYLHVQERVSRGDFPLSYSGRASGKQIKPSARTA